jgi:hypothetical protein
MGASGNSPDAHPAYSISHYMVWIFYRTGVLMGIVKTVNLEPGMTLESDVRDRSGRLLLRLNTQITEKSLRTLKAWGVTGVRIKDVADTASSADGNPVPDISPAILKAARDEASNFFTLSNLEHPLILELFEICVTKISLRGQEQK